MNEPPMILHDDTIKKPREPHAFIDKDSGEWIEYYPIDYDTIAIFEEEPNGELRMQLFKIKLDGDLLTDGHTYNY